LQQEKTERRTGVDALMLLHMRKLLKRLVAEVALIFADVAVNQRVLCQLLWRRKRLETQHALVVLLIRAMSLLGVTLHVRLVLELLPHAALSSEFYVPQET